MYKIHLRLCEAIKNIRSHPEKKIRQEHRNLHTCFIDHKNSSRLCLTEILDIHNVDKRVTDVQEQNQKTQTDQLHNAHLYAINHF